MKTLLPKTKTNPQGFTLIELLVVVAIIAILAAIGIVIFAGVQRNARDARRQSDVTAIAKAYEANKIANSSTYTQIQTSWFAGNTIPVDSYPAGGPNYAIAYTLGSGCTINRAAVINWATTSTVPTAGLTVSGPAGCTMPTPVAPASAPANIVSFQVCALLENGGANNVFCVPNSQ